MTARRSPMPEVVAIAAGLLAGNPALVAALSTLGPLRSPSPPLAPTSTFADEARLRAAEAKRARRAARRLGGKP